MHKETTLCATFYLKEIKSNVVSSWRETMEPDLVDDTTIEICTNYMSRFNHREELCLGFKVNSNVYNFGYLGIDCDAEDVQVYLKKVHGTLLYHCEPFTVTRKVEALANDNRIKLSVFYGRLYLVNIKVSYTRGVMFLKEVSCKDPDILTVSSVRIVLELYKLITGLGLGLYGHQEESKSFIESIDPKLYTPVTISYIELLSNIAEAFCNQSSVAFNPKYNGVCYWIYFSSTVPPSLVSQIRTAEGNIYKYIGRLSRLQNIRETERWALMIESIDTKEKNKVYVVTDSFRNNMDSYSLRDCLIRTALPKYLDTTEAYCIKNVTLFHTDNKILHRDNTYHNSKTEESLCKIMSAGHIFTDGYVVYIGNNRPTKVKLVEFLTADIELQVDDDLKSVWRTTNTFLLSRIKYPVYHSLEDLDQTSAVYEVSLYNGEIIRPRLDRRKGNPEEILERIVKCYKRDEKYSTRLVWSGESVKFSILVNRTFKHYLYFKYIKEGSYIIDLGSGNVGERNIWNTLKCKVVCIERDPKRFEVLKTKCSKDLNIIVFKDDMRNAMSCLKQVNLKYRTACFMRSISHLCKEDIVTLLKGLEAYGIKTILIVTMVSDWLQEDYYYEDSNKDYLKIVHNSVGKTSYVEWKIGSKNMSYLDNCYSTKEWRELATLSGLRIDIIPQSLYTSKAFNITRDFTNYSCYTDVGIILSRL